MLVFLCQLGLAGLHQPAAYLVDLCQRVSRRGRLLRSAERGNSGGPVCPFKFQRLCRTAHSLVDPRVWHGFSPELLLSHRSCTCTDIFYGLAKLTFLSGLKFGTLGSCYLEVVINTVLNECISVI